MWQKRAALVAAVAALPLACAFAADPPSGGMTLYNADGVPVAVLTPIQTTVSAAPAPSALQMIRQMQAQSAFDDPLDGAFIQIMSQQDAMMRRMVGQMQRLSLTTNPLFPGGAMNASIPGGQGVVREIVVSSFSSGGGSCRQTVTYSYAGASAQPQVSVQKVGDSCDALQRSDGKTLPVAAPDRESPPVSASPAPSTNQRVYRIKYRTPVHTASPTYSG
jgi:hypothetical protein